jgi:hypothetical protein
MLVHLLHRCSQRKIQLIPQLLQLVAQQGLWAMMAHMQRLAGFEVGSAEVYD